MLPPSKNLDEAKSEIHLLPLHINAASRLKEQKVFPTPHHKGVSGLFLGKVGLANGTS